jgi:polysaccharide biosynthesis transport protein
MSAALAIVDETNSSVGEDTTGGGTCLPAPTARRRWLITLVLGSLLAAAAWALTSYFFTDQYQASALLMIEDQAPMVVFEHRSTKSDIDRYVKTQLELLYQPMVLQPVLAHIEVTKIPELVDAPDPIELMRAALSTSRVGSSQLYSVKYTSASPKSAADVVNAVVSEYIKVQASSAFKEMQRVIDILEEERIRRSVEVERLRNRVLDLSKETTGRDPWFGNRLRSDDEVELTATLNQRLADIEADEVAVTAELQQLNAHPVQNKDAVSTSGNESSDVSKLSEDHAWREAIAKTETTLAEIKKSDSKWSNNPMLVRLDQELQSHKSAVNELEQKLAAQAAGAARQKEGMTSRQAARSLENQLAVLSAKKKALSARMSEIKSSRNGSAAKIVELRFASAELARQENVFEMIASRKMALQTELRAPARVQLLQTASVPEEPIVERHLAWRLPICIAALLLPFAAVLAIHPQQRRSK